MAGEAVCNYGAADDTAYGLSRHRSQSTSSQLPLSGRPVAGSAAGSLRIVTTNQIAVRIVCWCNPVVIALQLQAMLPPRIRLTRSPALDVWLGWRLAVRSCFSTALRVASPLHARSGGRTNRAVVRLPC